MIDHACKPEYAPNFKYPQKDPNSITSPTSGIAVSGCKYDGEKTRLELVDALAIEGLGDVLTFGAKKYAAHNWRGGIEYSRLIGALKRHLSAIEKGEDIDPESGLPHINHLGCCWMFLSNFMKTRPDLDDRWKAPK